MINRTLIIKFSRSALFALLIINLTGCASPYTAGFWQSHSQENVPWENGRIKRTFTNNDAARIRQFKKEYSRGVVITDCDPYMSSPNQPCKLLKLQSGGRVIWEIKTSPPVSKLYLSSGDYECVSLQSNKGNIVLRLDKIKAPESVRNFLSYAYTHYYDGTIFHRVIDGFVIQGGGFNENLEMRDLEVGYTYDVIINEADNGLLNTRGSIAAARIPDPHSATSQFFINVADNHFLDHKEKTMRGWGYAVFGQVVSGMDVVDSISKVRTGSGGSFQKDLPKENIIIESVKIVSCGDVNK